MQWPVCLAVMGAVMASKQKNPNIGMIVCSCCGKIAAVRREKNNTGKFYWDCLNCGRIKPNMPAGQAYIMERATIWGTDGAPPDNCPEWIAKQHNWRQALTAETNKPAPQQPASGADLPPPPPKREAEQPAPQQQQKKPGGFAFLENW